MAVVGRCSAGAEAGPGLGGCDSLFVGVEECGVW